MQLGRSGVNGLNLLTAPPFVALCLPDFLGKNSLRRHVMLGAFPHRPRWQWYLLLAYQTVSWFLIRSWWRLARVQFNVSQQPSATANRLQEIMDCMYLALACGVEPANYYRMKLYNWPKREWRKFIYPQEAASWHVAFNGAPDSNPASLLADKHRFSVWLADRDLRAVQTVYFLNKGDPINLTPYMDGTSYFIKPNQASAMRGCAELIFIENSYVLSSVARRDDYRITLDIEGKLRQLASRRDYLMQPLLALSSFTTDFYAVFITNGELRRSKAFRYTASSYWLLVCQQRKRMRIHLNASARKAD